MKKQFHLLLAFCLLSLVTFSQKDDTKKDAAKDEEKEMNAAIDKLRVMDSIEKSFKFQHGSISLKNGLGTVNVPAGFKYLDGESAEKVLVDFWGNPPSSNKSLGMIMPDSQNLSFGVDKGYVFNIVYEEMGYVKDDDANDIKYDELLAELKKDATEANIERVKNGFESATIVGWASTPFYDKERKILHWAKEIKFGSDSGDNTLNYDIRILGRKGVITMQAISTMSALNVVKNDIDKVLGVVQFAQGNQYKDFDSKVDNVAAWTIGGLVAGKLLAKAGLFAVIAKFGKFIVLGIVAVFGGLWSKLRGKKKEETTA